MAKVALTGGKKAAIGIISFLYAIFVFCGLTCYSVALPDILKEIPELRPLMFYGVILYNLGIPIALTISGYLMPVIGAYNTVLIGSIVAIIPQLLTPYIGSAAGILALRFVQGFTILGALAISLMYSYIYEPAEMNWWNGLLWGGMPGGGAIGGFLAGYLYPLVGWKLMYLYITALMIVFTVIWFAVVLAIKPMRSPSPSGSSSPNPEPAPDPPAEAKPLVSPGLVTILLALTMDAFTWQFYLASGYFPVYASSPEVGGVLNWPAGKIAVASLLTGLGGCVAAPISGIVANRLAKGKSGAALARSMLTSLMGGMVIAVLGGILIPILAPISFEGACLALFMSTFVWWQSPPYLAVPPAVIPDLVKAGKVTSVSLGIGNIPDVVAPIVTTALLGALGPEAGWTVSWHLSWIIATLGIWAPLALRAKLPKE